MLMQTQISSRITFPLSPTSNLSEFCQMLTPSRDAIHVANTNAQFSCGGNPVRFVVNGYALETTEATIRYVPGTYLTWLLDNCHEDVINGRPIQLKTSPKTFCNLIRRLRWVPALTSESRAFLFKFSYLREHRIPTWSAQDKTVEGERGSKRRRKAMEPGPILHVLKRKVEDAR